MRTSGGKRIGRRGGKRLDLEALKGALRDGRVWVSLGVVSVVEGESSHFALDGEDVLVDVELMPGGEPALCRLGSALGGAGVGIWAIPPVGSEVIVAIPDGDLAGDPVIVSVLASGQTPAGLAESTIVIVPPAGGKVLIHGGDAGAAVSLATRADVQAVVDAYAAHTHGGTVAVPSLTPELAPDPDGTAVLEAE